MRIAGKGLHLLRPLLVLAPQRAYGSSVDKAAMNKSPTQALLSLLLGAFVAMPAYASSVDESSLGEAVERHLSTDTAYRRWLQYRVWNW